MNLGSVRWVERCAKYVALNHLVISLAYRANTNIGTHVCYCTYLYDNSIYYRAVSLSPESPLSMQGQLSSEIEKAFITSIGFSSGHRITAISRTAGRRIRIVNLILTAKGPTSLVATSATKDVNIKFGGWQFRWFCLGGKSGPSVQSIIDSFRPNLERGIAHSRINVIYIVLNYETWLNCLVRFRKSLQTT